VRWQVSRADLRNGSVVRPRIKEGRRGGSLSYREHFVTSPIAAHPGIRAAFERARDIDSAGGTRITRAELREAMDAALEDSATPGVADDSERQAVQAGWTEHFEAGGLATAFASKLYRSAVDPTFGKNPMGYVAPTFAPYTAEEVRVPTPSGTLAGTVLLPKGPGPFPAVVFASGSTQNRRDDTISRSVAELLAQEGIASLRMDDLGAGESDPTPPGGWEAVTFTERTAMLKAGVEFLRTIQNAEGTTPIVADRIGLIGHSEGGMTAPLVAVDDPGIVAVAAVAAPGATGAELALHQLGEQSAKWQSELETLEASSLPEEEKADRAMGLQARIASNAPLLEAAEYAMRGDAVPEALLRQLAPHYRESLTYDPLETARRVTQPVLLIQGTNDWNVNAEQVDRLEQAIREGGNANVEVGRYEGLDHMLLPSEDVAPSDEAERAKDFDFFDAQSAEPLKQITKWMAAQLKGE
jgi:dienelactone hydrolase